MRRSVYILICIVLAVFSSLVAFHYALLGKSSGLRRNPQLSREHHQQHSMQWSQSGSGFCGDGTIWSDTRMRCEVAPTKTIQALGGGEMCGAGTRWDNSIGKCVASLKKVSSFGSPSVFWRCITPKKNHKICLYRFTDAITWCNRHKGS